MTWLRHELWAHDDGLSYRLASKAETDRLATTHPEGVIKHVFYAPNPAAAVAQYYALRHLGPYVPGPDVSQDGFSPSQLESQIADFPDDEILSAQATRHHEPDTHSAAAVHDVVETPHGHGDDHGATGHVEEHSASHTETDGHHPIPAEEPAVEHATHVPHQTEPATAVAETASHEPESGPAPHDPKDLWPVAEEEPVAPHWANRPRRKSNPVLGFLRVLLLLIILAAVAVGICIATGTVDGPTLLAQVSDLSIVKSVLSSA